MDEEKTTAGPQYLSGFGSLANFIASDPDHATAVHKTFDRLATRDLLYYEAELLELEALQDAYDLEDAIEVTKTDCSSRQWQEIRQNARDWSSFKRSAKESTRDDSQWKKRMELAMKIRATLKDYREALISNSQVLSLSRPSKQTMTALSNNFHQRMPTSLRSDGLADTDAILLGAGSRLLPLLTRKSSFHSTDHVSLKMGPEPDYLTDFLKTHCSWLFRIRQRSPGV